MNTNGTENGRLQKVHIRNFRALRDVELSFRPLNVFFGPNGAGKSTMLDALWFIHDCAVRGVDEAASFRNQGIGLLWDKAGKTEGIELEFVADKLCYKLDFGFSGGRVDIFPGESLILKRPNIQVVQRLKGRNEFSHYEKDSKGQSEPSLSAGTQLALQTYLRYYDEFPEVLRLSKLFENMCLFYTRDADIATLKKSGSITSTEELLNEHYVNLWSVLRNFHDKRAIDGRFEQLMFFMRKAFPELKDLIFEQTGRSSVQAKFFEKGRRAPIYADYVADGYIQMLLNLTVLFSAEQDQTMVLLLDEPETSLHPYAIAVFAEAVKHACGEWNRQVFIATHSPVLISQFEAEDIFAVEKDDLGASSFNRVSEIKDIKDLLNEYAVGSLYMSEMVAGQSPE